jgi:hypothetical protein
MAQRHGRRHRKHRRSTFDVAPTPVATPTPVTAPAAADSSVSAPGDDDCGHHGRHGDGDD